MIKHIVTLTKRNLPTVWMVFEKNGELLVRKANTTEFLKVSESPKYIQKFIKQNDMSEERTRIVVL